MFCWNFLSELFILSVPLNYVIQPLRPSLHKGIKKGTTSPNVINKAMAVQVAYMGSCLPETEATFFKLSAPNGRPSNRPSAAVQVDLFGHLSVAPFAPRSKASSALQRTHWTHHEPLEALQAKTAKACTLCRLITKHLQPKSSITRRTYQILCLRLSFDKVDLSHPLLAPLMPFTCLPKPRSSAALFMMMASSMS